MNPQRSGGDFGKSSNFGGRDSAKDSSFATQNRFNALNAPSSFDRAGPKDENDKHLETIQKEMDIWESSGQWIFSCYAALKSSISGFVELSPEELRVEYYNGRASGDLQAYGNSVQQLVGQWRSRLQELKAMSGSTRSALIAELSNPGQQTSSFGSASSSFGSSATGFGSTAPSGFGSTASGFGAGSSSAGFGTSAQSSATFSFASNQNAVSTGFGSAAAQQSFGSTPAPAPEAASFSFASPTSGSVSSTVKDASSGFGVSAANFSFASGSASATVTGFGGGFGGQVSAVSTSGFGQPSGGSNKGLFASGAVAASTIAGTSVRGLFTPQSELTADELKEFSGKRFTLGQVPLKPPPADLLVV